MKIALNFWDNRSADFKIKILRDVLIDRKSKYTALWWRVNSKQEVTEFMKELLKDKYYAKATHNTYAFRIEQSNGSILESRNDDGETWAGNCILRELQRENIVNTIVVVTRYFWWVQLHADRFKNVIMATKLFLEKIW